MRMSECVIGCEFMKVRKRGRVRDYRCLSPKAPEKERKRIDEVQGRLINDLEFCPEGLV